MAERVILLLGGVRSGKTAFAQRLAHLRRGQVLYMATGAPGDAEMQRRIDEHRRRRPPHWCTLEVTSGVGPALLSAYPAASTVILDCITLLLSNLLTAEEGSVADLGQGERRVQEELAGLFAALDAHAAEFILISNEVGMGIVPPYPLGRVYRDLLGLANQQLAARADLVYLMVAGLPLLIKGKEGPEGPAAPFP